MTNTEQRTPTAIDAIAEAWVDTELELFPEYHVYLGREGREGEYADYSPAGSEQADRERTKTLALLARAQPADDIDTITKLDLTRELELGIAKHEAGFDQRDLNVIASPAQGLREIFDLAPVSTEADWAAVAKRLNNLPAAMDGYLEMLRSGVTARNVPAIRQVAEVIGQAEKLAAPSGFFHQLAAQAKEAAVGLSPTLERELTAGAKSSAAAYELLAVTLRDEIAPHAPERDAVGRDLYTLASRDFLGATIDLDETYEWGIDELRKMTAEQEAVAREIKPGASVREAIAHLDGDPTRKLHGTDALQRWMQATSDRAIEELGATHFDIPAEVRRLECMIAPTQEGGIYYTGPSDDFARAGRMWWSVPEGVTEFDTWRELTTVYHEGVPGHHLQIAQAVFQQENLNRWQRLMCGTSGHAEGWALYAERLMEELGYLADPGDHLGMLDAQLLRAARVVVDLGVHLELPIPAGTGWNEGETWDADLAWEFLRSRVQMDEDMLRFELERYLGWPGQAPSYKLGERIWLQAREDARNRQGADFSLREFHRQALALGSMGLDPLVEALGRL